MNSEHYKRLDNPVWNALQTVHEKLSIGTDEIKRYPSHVLRIMGCENPETADLSVLNPWMTEGEKIYMVGKLAPAAKGWAIDVKLDCVQMVCENDIALSLNSADEISILTEDDHDLMFDLINLVQPGYFQKKTPLLGNYYGIKKDNQLVAMAGERLKMTGFTEISAVATHPSFTGKGYAQKLVSHVARENMQTGNIPFLHFVNSNTRARKVYELLGFKERKIVPFWGLIYQQ